MRIRSFVGVIVLLFPIASAVESGSGPSPQAAGQKISGQTKRLTATVVRPTVGPQISEFTATPNPILKGEHCRLRWKVGPGPGDSPIESLEIRSGTPTAPGGSLYRRLLLEGTYSVGPVLGDRTGLASYTLTVTDRAGQSANRTVEVRTESWESFLAGLSGLTFDLRTVVEPGHRNHTATVGLESGSPATAQNLIICLYQAYSPIMLGIDIPDSPLAGNFNVADLVPGHNEFRIGLTLRPISLGNDDRRALSKIVLIIAKEYSPGVFDRILIKALYDLIETGDGQGPLYSVRLIKVG